MASDSGGMHHRLRPGHEAASGARSRQVDALQDQGQLTGLDLDVGARRQRQLEGAFLQPLVEDPEPAAIPAQDLHPVAAAIAEHEHVAAAIWYHVMHHSDLLVRMLPASHRPDANSRRPAQLFTTLGILVLLGSGMIAWALSRPDGASVTVVAGTSPTMSAPEIVEIPEPGLAVAGPGRSWSIDHAQSRLGFTGLYAGVDFDGEFEEFSATMIFDPDDPGMPWFVLLVLLCSLRLRLLRRLILL